MRVFIVVLATALVSCSSAPPEPMRLTGITTERRLTESDAVEVELSATDRSRVDKYVKAMWLGEHPVGIETGTFWQMAFKGRPGDPILRIKSAELRESLGGAGFTLRYTYTAECEITHKGKVYKIKAEGTRAAAMFTMSAMRQAVELGVADAAAKAREITKK